MGAIIVQIQAVSAIVDAIWGSEVAAALGHFLGKELFQRGKLTDEQKAKLDAHYADYAAREARLQAEIGNVPSPVPVDEKPTTRL
jgi:hypothetical protein